MQSPHTCAILLKAIRRERGIKRRRKSKNKIERMKLKPLSGTQRDITNYIATLAGHADLVLELGRDKRAVVRLTFPKVKVQPACFCPYSPFSLFKSIQWPFTDCSLCVRNAPH